MHFAIESYKNIHTKCCKIILSRKAKSYQINVRRLIDKKLA